MKTEIQNNQAFERESFNSKVRNTDKKWGKEKK